MSSLRKQKYFTPAEYLELERAAEARSEYLDGEILLMSGGSPKHSIISINLVRELSLGLRGKKCQPFDKDMKVGSKRSLFYFYPDASVVCGEQLFHDKHQDVCTNPTAIFEVLSPNTEGYDRGKKFSRYQMIDSLTDYLLINQDEPRVEHFSRTNNDVWSFTVAHGIRNNLHIASIDCQLSLAELYERIEFPERKRPASGKRAAKRPAMKARKK